MDNFIPFSRPSIGEEEIEAVTEVLKSGWLTVGPKVKEFEEEVKKYTKAHYVVATDSCTSALTIALRSLLVSKAVIPALTFVATANAAYNAFYEVEFCDVGMDGNIDSSKIVSNNQVTVPVHFAGQVCDLEEIKAKSGYVIEDAAHAFGATYKGHYLGATSYSNGACFSFYPTKNMTTVEGGLLITYFPYIDQVGRSLSLHGLSAGHVERYSEISLRSSLNKPMVHMKPGYKANMTDVEASIGIEQLKKLDYFLQPRKKIANIYMDELDGRVKFLDLNGRDHVWHMFVILVEDRDNFIAKMKERGVGAGIHYSPIIPAHPFYQKLTNYQVGDFPVAEYIASHCVSLPLYPSLTNEEVEKVINTVKEIT